jgi:hypothetical protein
MPGATFLEVIRSPNSNPEKCSTDTGVTFLKSDFATITIEKGGLKIECWRVFTTKFNPGVNYQ